jgi:hypothetical protein
MRKNLPAKFCNPLWGLADPAYFAGCLPATHKICGKGA